MMVRVVIYIYSSTRLLQNLWFPVIQHFVVVLKLEMECSSVGFVLNDDEDDDGGGICCGGSSCC